MPMPAWIARLAREGSIPRSQIGGEGEPVLAQLRALGLAAEEVQGSKRRVVARDLAALNRWVTATYPPADDTPRPGLRASNIARARRSKAGETTHLVQPLLLRWFDPDPTHTLGALTRRFGLVGLTSDRVSSLETRSPWTLLTVENWEPFVLAAYEQCENAIIVAYTGGNIADAAIRALASIQPAPQRAIHFGDYDWSGLGIYRRMRRALPHLELYVPDDIEARFSQFADVAVLEGQPPLIPQADDTDQVRRVISLIARHNGGLEQEIVPPPYLP